jgi:colanic acid/amylovoran biosynthesis glycosyltransferase
VAGGGSLLKNDHAPGGAVVRIAFITSVFPSLAETFILNQVTGLLDSGYDLTIFARADPHEEKVHPDIDTYNLIERTRYFDIPVSVGKRLARGAILAARNLPRRPGAVARSLNVFRYGTPALSLTLLYAAVSPFEGKFDILHCHFGPNGFVGDFLRDKNGSAKLLVSFHGHDANSYPRTASSGVYRRLFDGADAFTANTNFTKEQMVRLGCNADKRP